MRYIGPDGCYTDDEEPHKSPLCGVPPFEPCGDQGGMDRLPPRPFGIGQDKTIDRNRAMQLFRELRALIEAAPGASMEIGGTGWIDEPLIRGDSDD